MANLARGGESNLSVRRIVGVVVVGLVAGDAGRLIQLVIAVDVTIAAGARRHGVRTGQGPPGGGVIESAVHPVDGVVTGVAGRGKACLNVVHRRRGVVVVVLVAAHARSIGEVVVAIDVAVAASARRYGVRASEGPAGGGVIKRAIHPVDGVMAALAGGGEMGPNVVDRRLGVVVIGLVAADARSIGEVVVAIDVAVGAGARWHGVRTREGPAGGGVIERGIHPVGGVMAGGAGGGEMGPSVVHRRLRFVVVGLVTRNAGRVGDGVIVVDVAVGAGARRHRVRAGQRKARLGVIETRRRPG